jgi:hypothetical protein
VAIIMKNKWIIYGAAVLLLAGCQKPADTSDQTASTNGTDATAGGNRTGSASGQKSRETRKSIVVPAGTEIPVILSSSISSKVNKPGENFEASVASPVMVGDGDAIPKGARVTGTIVDAKKQGTFKGAATLAIRLTNLTVHGKDYPITTDVYAGSQKGKGKRTAVMTGGGAAVGALIGGLAGGGKGAAIGAGVGGGGGLAASGATGGKNVEFPAESQISFKLSEDLTIER